MQYIVIRTNVRPVSFEAAVRAVVSGRDIRDETRTPEVRVNSRTAADAATAQRLARELAASELVRAGQQRVKVVCVD